MSCPLTGRVAVVTGAGVRLGRAIAEALGEAGADVVLHFHASRDGAEAAAASIRALGRRAEVVGGDLTDPAAVDAVFAAAAKLGGCDLLVNSAAIFERKPLEAIDPACWRRMIDTNLSAPFYCCRAAAAQMGARGRGDIINIVDVGGALRPWRQFSHYCAAKAGLQMLTECLAVELAPTIRVNAIAPGTVLLPEGTPADEASRLLARIPSGRFGTPRDIVEALLFLVAGPRFITGQTLAVDGGRSLA